MTKTSSLRADEDKWLRRQALQLTAQLPDDAAQALLVLEYAKQVVLRFWVDGDGFSTEKAGESDLHVVKPTS